MRLYAFMAAAGLALCSAFLVSASANDEVEALSKNEKNWAMQLGNYSGHRFSTLDQITRENVDELQVAWQFSTGVLRGHEGGPLVIDDAMYIHTPFPNAVYKLDLNAEGRILWKYEPRQDASVIPVMCCDTVNRGVAYADGKIFLAQADNTLVALDSQTGEPVWSVSNGDHSRGETLTAAPVIAEDKVLVGISGGEFGVRGHLTAYNIDDGSLAWRAYSTGPDEDVKIDPEKTLMMGRPIGEADLGKKTWPGDEWKRGGGTTWGWFTYDPELEMVYYGTGNPGTWNPVQRAKNFQERSDNKWSMSIFARDIHTGEAKWVYQKTPFDEWDYDGVNEHILIDREIDGEMRKLIVTFDRNGFAYTLDRVNGELLVAEKFDPVVNWATHVDMETGRPQVVERYSTFAQGQDVNTTGICPAALGTKDQQPATYSPETGLFYVPTNHICMDYEPFEVAYVSGQPYVGATLTMYPAPDSHGGQGNFIAWDPLKGEVVWSKPERFAVWSGALATSGDVVFYGTLEGHVKAVDKTSGDELWSFKTPSGIIGNVNTYEHNGKQYVAVLSGIGGWAGIGLAAGLTDPQAGLGAVGTFSKLSDYTQLGGVLTVFELPDGRAASESVATVE